MLRRVSQYRVSWPRHTPLRGMSPRPLPITAPLVALPALVSECAGELVLSVTPYSCNVGKCKLILIFYVLATTFNITGPGVIRRSVCVSFVGILTVFLSNTKEGRENARPSLFTPASQRSRNRSGGDWSQECFYWSLPSVNSAATGVSVPNRPSCPLLGPAVKKSALSG